MTMRDNHTITFASVPPDLRRGEVIKIGSRREYVWKVNDRHTVTIARGWHAWFLKWIYNPIRNRSVTFWALLATALILLVVVYATYAAWHSCNGQLVRGIFWWTCVK